QLVVAARGSAYALTHIPEALRDPARLPLRMMDDGWPSERCRHRFLDYLRDLACTDRDLFCRGLWMSGAPAPVVMRQQFAQDRQWYRSLLFNEYFRVGELDDSLHATWDVGAD